MRWIWAATGAMLAATAMAVGCSRGPDPKRIGVFAEAAGSPVEVTSYGVEELHESFSAGMWIEFKFEDPAKIPSLDGPVKAFYFNIPDAVVSESAVYALDSLGVKWRTNKKDRKPLAARLENISGTMYRLTEFEAAASKSRYLALLISMPRGTVDRLYAVRLQGEPASRELRRAVSPRSRLTTRRRHVGPWATSVPSPQPSSPIPSI